MKVILFFFLVALKRQNCVPAYFSYVLDYAINGGKLHIDISEHLILIIYNICMNSLTKSELEVDFQFLISKDLKLKIP